MRTKLASSSPSILLCFVGLLAFSGNVAAAAESDFERDVKPFLAQHCLECHGEKAKAGYRIDQLGIDFTAASVADAINAAEARIRERLRRKEHDAAAIDAAVARLREPLARTRDPRFVAQLVVFQEAHEDRRQHPRHCQ